MQTFSHYIFWVPGDYLSKKISKILMKSVTRQQQNRVVKLYINSRDRDTAVYPNPNRFRVYLLQPLCAVKKITLGGAIIPSTGSYPYVVIASDLYLRGVEFPTQMAQYPAGILGIVLNNSPTEKFMRYNDEGNGSTWEAVAPGVIPRLQEFEISLLADGALYPLVPYAPGKYPEWSCVLKIELDS